MFCTTLRRRPSYAPVISQLTNAEGLQLREGRLETHDIAISLSSDSNVRSGKPTSTRQLRLLLLSPSTVSPTKLPDTMTRIQHFAVLTGGQDLAIILLLNPPATSNFISAKDLATNAALNDTDTKGIYAFTSLQAVLFTRTDIPYIPILPIASLEALPQAVKKHAAALSRPKVDLPLAATPFDLLQLCTTAEPAMDRRTAVVATEVVDDLRELAEVCTGAEDRVGLSSPPMRGVNILHADHGNAELYERLQRMKALLTAEERRQIGEFWGEEWAVD